MSTVISNSIAKLKKAFILKDSNKEGKLTQRILTRKEN